MQEQQNDGWDQFNFVFKLCLRDQAMGQFAVVCL